MMLFADPVWFVIAVIVASGLLVSVLVTQRWVSVEYSWDAQRPPLAVPIAPLRAGIVGAAVMLLLVAGVGVFRRYRAAVPVGVPRQFTVGAYMAHGQVMLPPELRAPHAPPCYVIASVLPTNDAEELTLTPAMYAAPNVMFCILMAGANLPVILEVTNAPDGTLGMMVREFFQQHDRAARTWL
ncbi:hypothetical protein HYV74_01725 [Candidatus Uhrbacteria bacterium]|nr:hypothetical protein [Candidatus Uhrbacteria bacterium]